MSNKTHIFKTLVISMIASVLCFLLVKFFVLDVDRVNSLSMLPTFKQGSVVFVKPISFLQNTIEQNDVVLVEQTDTSSEQGLFLKRIMAVSGDTLLIDSSIIYVNGKRLAINDSLLHNYVIKFKQQKDTVLFNEEKFDEKYLIDDSCVYMVTINRTRAAFLKRKNISIEEQIEGVGLYDENIFTHHPKIKWNKDFFGEVYIPKQGDTLRFDTISVCMYKQLIQNEGNAFKLDSGKILINNQASNYYITKENYYFLIGDNLDNSIDSRHWGLISKKNIKAVAFKK